MSRVLLMSVMVVLVGVGGGVADDGTSDAAGSHRFSFELVGHVNEPSRRAEIIQVDRDGKRLFTTNPRSRSIDCYRIDRFSADGIHWQRQGEEAPLFSLPGEPTSIALHPHKPLAVIAVLGRNGRDPGELILADCRQGRSVLPLACVTAGIGPDCVVISPDGRWAIAAIEAEADDQSPGGLACLGLAGVTLDEPCCCVDMPLYRIDGLDRLLNLPAGELEPEYVAFDPRSRLAVVTCQENDALVIVDCCGDTPQVVQAVRLADGAAPDGVAVIDGVPGPDGRDGLLIGIAEEGRKARRDRRTGQALSLYWLDPEDTSSPVWCLGRFSVAPWLGAHPSQRLDPEGIAMARLGGSLWAFLAVERTGQVIAVNIDNPTEPTVLGVLPTGDRPEGIVTVHQDENTLLILTANEGKKAIAPITIARLVVN